ncbi:MAG: tetratricopeptide repeat protein [bacterium]|nr:tetratricopeptide repeat protein [bacterium]
MSSPTASEQAQIRGDHAPLLFELLHLLARLVGLFGVGALGTFHLYSWGSGVLYVALVPLVACDLTPSVRGRALLVGLLLTQGYLQLFFGYAETYPAVLPLLLLYLWVGCRALQEGRVLWPVVLMGVLPTCHLLTLVLWPSLGYVAWWRATRDGGSRLFAVAQALLPAAGITVCALLLLDRVPWSAPADAVAHHYLPLIVSQPTTALVYGLLSWDHLLNVLNVLVLAAPVPALLLPWLINDRHTVERRTRFLLLAFVAMQGAVVVINPGIGAMRDWDMLALPTLPLTLWVGVRLLQAGPALTGRGISSLLLAGGIHLALWVTLNADLDGSTQRFASWLHGANLSAHARGYGAGTLARQQRDRGYHRDSLAAYRLAVAARPGHPRHLRGAGFEAIELEEFDEALTFFDLALQVDSTDAAAWEGLGIAHVSRGDHDDGLRALQRAVSLSPVDGEFLVNLCQAHNLLGQYDAAIEACNRALVIAADDVAALHQLTATFAALGDEARARIYLQRLYALDADHGRRLEVLLNASGP